MRGQLNVAEDGGHLAVCVTRTEETRFKNLEMIRRSIYFALRQHQGVNLKKKKMRQTTKIFQFEGK